MCTLCAEEQHLLQACGGEVQLGQEGVQVGQVEELDSQQVWHGRHGDRHLLLAEARDAGVSLTRVTTSPGKQRS